MDHDCESTPITKIAVMESLTMVCDLKYYMRLEDIKLWISNISVTIFGHLCHVEIGKITGGGAGTQVVNATLMTSAVLKAQNNGNILERI